MDNPETLATLGTQESDTELRKRKQTTKNPQKTKKMSNTVGYQ
jgi:hypothetical protein